MTIPDEPGPTTKPWRSAIDDLPVGLFGASMGLTGLSGAWQIAHEFHGAPAWPASAMGLVAIVAFASIAVAYAFKAITAPAVVAAEFRHPVNGCLFGTIFVSLLVLPFATERYSRTASLWLWALGATGMIGFAFLMIGRWIRDPQLEQNMSPVWVIPIVGLLDVPLAMPALGLAAYRELMVFSLTVGLFFTVPIFTLVFRRLLLDDQRAAPPKPTLLVLMAPFAVGYSVYEAVTAANDLFAQGLVMLTVFLLVVLGLESRRLVQMPFRLSWWATSFPLAAASIATLKFSAVNPTLVSTAVSWAVLGLATACIGALLVLSLAALGKGELRTVSG